MILDYENLFTDIDGQAVTASAATANSVQLQTYDPASDTPRDIGVANNLHVVAVVTEAFTTGEATITVSLQTDTVSAFSSATTLLSSAAFDVDDLPVGKKIDLGVIPSGCEKYLRGYFTVASGPAAGGKIAMFCQVDGQDNPYGEV